MKTIDKRNIESIFGTKITFIRVDPEDLKDTIQYVINEISNLSWISKFDEEYTRKSFFMRAEPTVDLICGKLKCHTDDVITSEMGEYIVSELGKDVISKELSYKKIPLCEIFKEQISGNPGFDFISENILNNFIIFGEAKYVCGKNAYGRALSQIEDFINLNKDYKDINSIDCFLNEKSLNNFEIGLKGYAAAFSSTNTPTDVLLRNIKKNSSFKELQKYRELILVAVDICK